MADKAKGLLEDGREHVVALAQPFAAMGDWTEAAAERPSAPISTAAASIWARWPCSAPP